MNHTSANAHSQTLKVALVHDFLTQSGGAERILDCLLDLFPTAPVYTLIYSPARIGQRYAKRKIRPSVLQTLPGAQLHSKWYLPLMTWATDRMALPADLDLVISDASAYAKGVRVPPGVPHLCYLHTPTRYLWSVRDEYVRDAPIPAWIRPFVGPVLDHHKRWDYLAAQRPDVYIANSRHVAAQMEQYYNRSADQVIFPFVDLDRFSPAPTVSDYVLTVGRLEPYKRIDLVIEACIQLSWPLKVVGTGSWLERYRHQYRSHTNVEFLGRVSDEELPQLYAQAKVFVFPASEDAGITPLESMASGRPVLAFKAGGALESVIPGVTGEFFTEQSVAALVAALGNGQWTRYTQTDIRHHAEGFARPEFERRFMDVVDRLMQRTARSRQASVPTTKERYGQ
ncbi:glycosyltransferase [Candidatus Berkelbacteria bacterium]|nr:glycosyltransferase [Candidatus Berkelbacteria bacterium]